MARYGLQVGYSFQVCGLLHRLSRENTTIVDFVEQYETGNVPLLGFYIGRDLSFQSDAFNAFLGLLNAQSHLLGDFHWGLPLRLFTKTLFLSISSQAGPLSRRFGFPSWSRLG
jgi:hypothetical protein